MSQIEKALDELEARRFSIGSQQYELRRKISFPEIEQIDVNPVKLSVCEKGPSLLFVLQWTRDLGGEVPKTYFAHNLLWQLFSVEAKRWFDGCDESVKVEVWEAIEWIYTNFLEASEDPEWIKSGPKIKERILS